MNQSKHNPQLHARLARTPRDGMTGNTVARFLALPMDHFVVAAVVVVAPPDPLIKLFDISACALPLLACTRLMP